MKYLIDDSTLEHELRCAEARVANAKAILDAANNHLTYIKERNAKLGAHPAEPTNLACDPRLPNQTKISILWMTINYNNIGAIKAIREFTNLGLKEAKDRVEGKLPITIELDEGSNVMVTKDVPAACDRVQRALSAAGCVVTWVD